jgi:predicted RNase H-related nuclease YkuK (DUF458 family)
MAKWKALSGAKIDDLAVMVREATKAGQELHVGCDSLQTGRFTQFVVVVVTHTPGKGGRVAYSREVVPRITSLRERLFKEVWSSVQIAMDLANVAGGPITVHIDANTNERHMSSKYVEELAGLAMGQGFKTLVKPESWAASHAADHVVRTRGKLPSSHAKTRRRAA